MEKKHSRKTHNAKINSYQSIHEAVKSGDVECVELMVKEGASVNELDNSIHKFTPLHWTCQKGSLECLHWLLWHGADPSVNSTKGWTPLHIAAIRGHDSCIQALLNNKVDILAKDIRGNTACHLAVTHGHVTALATLLRSGIDANVKNKRGWSPVHCSAFHGRLGCLQVLVKWGGKVDETDNSGNNAAHLAAMAGHLVCFKFIVGEGRNNWSTCLSARNNNGETPKILAQQTIKSDIVDYINHLEWERDHPEEAQNMAFPAHLAAYTGDLEQLKMLIENNLVGINERDSKGSTPAHKAAGQGNLEVLQWLVEFGADVNITNQAGETAKDVARRFAQLSAIKMLGGDEVEDKESDEGEEGVEFYDDNEVSSRKTTNIQNAKANARKRLEESLHRLEIAKRNYIQVGGKVDDVLDQTDEEVYGREIKDLKEKLEIERHDRECLEEKLEDYKDEIIRLSCQLQQIMREQEEMGEREERTSQKKLIKKEKKRFK